MCGIAGHFGPARLSEAAIRSTLALMRRRGPDHAGWEGFTSHAGRHAHLLATRLRIIDLDDRANQPFRVGTKTMVFNGELYNYLELRQDLERQGANFSTNSDTEVLLRALDRWGWGALDRCEGMWACAVYDSADGSLTLSRDRFGEKPLYLYLDGDDVYFGSEIKFLAELSRRRFDIDHTHLYRYLVNGYKALYKDPRRSFFKGVSELPPATTLRYESDGRSHEQRYWLPCYAPEPDMTYEQAVAGARERLIRSMEFRLRADVPLAFCMSGGVDSNALISIAKRVFDYDVHGFTIVNTDARYEETDMVECAISAQGLRHTNIVVEPRDFLPRLRTLVGYHDAPVATISYFAHWLLMERVADERYRIAVSGAAADELFTGYYDHHLAYLYEIRAEASLHQASRQAWERYVKPLVRNPHLSDPELFVRNPCFRDHIFLDSAYFSDCLRQPWNEPFTETHYADSLLRNRMLNEMFHEAVPVILHEDDLNAMYFSIENRSPYLDRRLFDFCYSIPSRHLIRDGRTKAVLRDAVRGIVPDAIIDNRRKVGFNAPIFSFLDVSDPEVRSELLADGPIWAHVHRERVEELIDKHDLPNSRSKFLFYFICSKFFLEGAT